ncbi:MAG: thioesterase [Anaerolineae bacterium]|nr:thioesterase [Anaerolineae bacterium]
MAYLHTVEFQIRHYECDPRRQLHAPVLLGYLQEAAFAGSAAVGYSAHRYQAIGFQWFAYETEVELHAPLHYGDRLTVRTWVHDFRRVRSLRQYEVFRDGIEVARASTDWVFINAQTLYPSAIPPEIVSAYSLGEPVAAGEPRPPFPKFPEVPSTAFQMTRRVEGRDLDPAGHVNNATYLAYLLEAHRLAGGGDQRLVKLQIEYKQAALQDDLLTVQVWQAEDQVCGVIHRDQKLITRAVLRLTI